MAIAPFLIAGPSWAQSQSGQVKSVHLTLQAFADRTGIVPGETFNVAIVAQVEPDWNIYWQDPGLGGGLPTKIEWKAPAGFDVGRTSFPTPDVKNDPVLQSETFILQGEAIFVTPIRAPRDARVGENVQFSAEVSFLVCKKECIPGKGRVEISLPIKSPGAAEVVNAELFSKARRRLPIALAQAQHLKIVPKLDRGVVKPGETANVVLDIAIDKGHHMQANKPRQEFLIPAYAFVVSIDGFGTGEIVYPVAHDRDDPSGEKFLEYSGNIQIKIPLTSAEDAGTEPRWARGVLQYQICNDSGTCFPPQYVEWSVPIQMQGGPVPAAEPQWSVAGSGLDSDVSGENEPVRGSLSRGLLARVQDYFLSLGYIGVLVMAFVGGLIMNLMPCVLPVISLKVLSFVRQAQEDRARIFALGLTYCLGIMVFFTFIAGLFLWNGTEWGQLFQNPRIVLGLAAVVTAFSLSLFGVFAVFTPRVINVMAEKAEGEGLLSAFTTGMLATFLGTACTAPFLSAAVGVASQYAGAQGASIFLAVGLGMAFPFIFLSANPGWLKFIPRPGPWMGTFEAVMGFLLLGTVIWLLNPLRGQIGDYGLLLALIFLLAVAMAVWIKGKVQFGDSPWRKLRIHSAAILVLLVGWLVPFRVMATIPQLINKQIERQDLIGEAQQARLSGQTSSAGVRAPTWPKTNDEIPWQHYKRSRTLEAVRAGYTVFVDYTADWCANCKTMLKTAIETEPVIKTMKELNVIPFSADYTLPKDEIKEDLKRFKRGGVPVFVIYAPGKPDDPELLPEVITADMLVEALKRAGPSRPKP